MSCEDSSAATDRYHYSHNETATIRLYSSPTRSRPWSLNSRVLLESTSTLRSSTPIFHLQNGTWGMRKDATLNGTPFSAQVLELLSRYPLQRLLIRVGDAAASSGGSNNAAGADEQQMLQDERARGPSGTSISASFAHSSSHNHHDTNESEVMISFYQNQYASLLRYLLDNTLFPPCGAPLDSLRVRKHGHSLIVRAHPFSSYEEDHSTLETVDVESFLAADGATFCNPGIHSFILSQREHANAGVGWGAAANNGACHSSDTWGLFDSLFSSSSGVILSELLLGTSRDSTPWTIGNDENANKRNSVWIDLQVSPTCFASIGDYAGGKKCSLSVTRGVSYRVAMPSHTQTSTTDENEKLQNLTLSLGDLLVGHHTVQHSRSSQKEELRAWYPCPMSESSRVVMYLPNGYAANLKDANNSLRTGFDGERWHEGRMEFDVLALKYGLIDLASPWTMLSHIVEDSIADPSTSLYGISRTVQRPSGIASGGTMVSVLRYETIQSESDKQNIVKVQSLDVLPGTILKPRMRSLRMTLYQGGGASGARFVPPSDCEQLQNNETMPWSIDGAIYKTCGSVHATQLSLAQLEDHRLTLHPDGTMLLERTIFLHPDSSLWMMVDFDEAYLPFQKFPADANRGVDVFPSEATFTPVIASSSFETLSSPSITLYSSSLVILPPVPDMSMPFNVISLSCTLWAFVLGSLLNTLVRRGTESVKRELTGEKEKRPIDKLREKIKDKVGKLRGALRRIVGDKATTGESTPSVDTESSSRNE